MALHLAPRLIAMQPVSLRRRSSTHSLDEDSMEAAKQPSFFATLAAILVVTAGVPAVILARGWDVPWHDSGATHSPRY